MSLQITQIISASNPQRVEFLPTSCFSRLLKYFPSQKSNASTTPSCGSPSNSLGGNKKQFFRSSFEVRETNLAAEVAQRRLSKTSTEVGANDKR